MNIVITGAGSGIGRATAVALARDGDHHLVVLGRKNQDLEILAAEIRQINQNVAITEVVFDLTQDREAFTQLATQIEQDCGHVDVLVSNAGLLINKPFLDLSEHDWLLMFETNVLATVKLVSCLFPLLKKAERAHLVTIGSMGVFQGTQKFPGLSTYSASKAALSSLTECLAVELQDTIHSNCLCFGSVATEMFRQAFPDHATAITAEDAGEFVAQFALHTWKVCNGKIIPVAVTTP